MLFSRDRTVRPDALFVGIGSTWGNVYRMKKNSLLTTNNCFKKQALRDRFLCQTVLSFCTVESVHRAAQRALASATGPPTPSPLFHFFIALADRIPYYVFGGFVVHVRCIAFFLFPRLIS